VVPQSDTYPETIEQTLRALVVYGRDAGRDVLAQIAYPKRELRRRPSVSKAVAAHVFKRDHFLCRYCGGKTILTAVMELLGGIYPEIFPFHRNWKGGSTHPSVISRSAVVDHIEPGARGGDWLAEPNLVTACWPCNARKADLTLAELGWTVRLVEDGSWDGLTGFYPAVWQLAGRPNERSHLEWMRCLGLPIPD